MSMMEGLSDSVVTGHILGVTLYTDYSTQGLKFVLALRYNANHNLKTP